MRLVATVLTCLLGLSLLAGCGTTPAPIAAAQTSIAASLVQLGTFTAADLAAAEADAVAHADVVAIRCYPALATFVASLQPANSPPLTVSGAFLLHQQARDLANAVQAHAGTSLIPATLKLACAAMVQDDATFIAGLAAIGGGVAIVGPVVPALLGGVQASVGAALLR